MSKTKEKRYQVATSQGNNGPRVTFSGDLSLNSVKGLKGELAALLNRSSSIQIVVKDAESIDLGFIQLLQAFVWDTLKSKNRASVELELSPDQQKLLCNAGIKLRF